MDFLGRKSPEELAQDKAEREARHKREAADRQAVKEAKDKAEAIRLANPRCVTCRYWETAPEIERADNQRGRCFCNPPVISNPAHPGPGRYGVWPETFGSEFCGRYEKTK